MHGLKNYKYYTSIYYRLRVFDFHSSAHNLDVI